MARRFDRATPGAAEGHGLPIDGGAAEGRRGANGWSSETGQEDDGGCRHLLRDERGFAVGAGEGDTPQEAFLAAPVDAIEGTAR